MSSETMNRRLSNLEKRRGTRDAVLSFADGSKRAIRVRDPLTVLLASFRQRWEEMKGQQPEASEHDSALRLFRNAESVQGDALFELVLDNERQRKEERQ